MQVKNKPLKKNIKKVYVDSTDYCEEAELDTQQLINIVKLSSEQKNFSYTNNICQADLILYRACGHLQSLQEKSIRDIKKILRLKKRKCKIIVWGCLAKINPASLKEVYDGPLIGPEEALNYFYNYFFLPKNKEFNINANSLHKPCISELMENRQLSLSEKIITMYKFFDRKIDGLFNFRKNLIMKNMWYIKIVNGCKNSCTYCTDRLAYKSLKSEPFEKIIRQFELGLNKGYRYFFLVGRDLGSYGYDTGITLTNLLEKILERNRKIDYKILLNNISPNSLIELYPKLEPMLASKKIISLGSAIQSGSNRILKLMGKNLSLVKWIETITDIRKKYPKITLETSIMVGFPSETEKDFAQSLNLLNNVLFDRVAVYKYNERPNLPSLRIKTPIPEITKNKRYKKAKYYRTLNKIKKWKRYDKFHTLSGLNLFVNMARILLAARFGNYFYNLIHYSSKDEVIA